MGMMNDPAMLGDRTEAIREIARLAGEATPDGGR